MAKKKADRPLYQRIALDIAGFGLMIISPFLGWLPGPGGIPLFVAGLSLVALNHEWAERLLKDFDKRRTDFSQKYLMANPKISVPLDILSISAIITGLYVALTEKDLLLRGLGIAGVTIFLIILLSNQRRIERIAQKLKKR